jgi:hypothetical protein
MPQNDFWTENLQPASLDGIVFEIAERRVTTGRALARYRYPYRDGQGVEDLGRSVYVWNLEVPLYRSVGLAQYPGTLDDLIRLVEDADKKAEVEYVDPEWGPFRVKIPENGFEWSTTGETRDGGMLSLTLEEISFDQSVTQNLESPRLAGRANAAFLAGNIDNNLQNLDAPDIPSDIDPNEGFSLTDTWNAVQNGLDTAALAADDVAAKIDEVTLISQKILNFSAGDELERFSLYNSTVDFIAAAKDVGDDSGDAPPGETLVERTLTATLSSFQIAQWLYGDSFRASEIEFNNPTPNPLAYPIGTTIKVFEA